MLFTGLKVSLQNRQPLKSKRSMLNRVQHGALWMGRGFKMQATNDSETHVPDVDPESLEYLNWQPD